MLFAQDKETYLETNVGLSYTSSLLEVVPGVSFLYGTKRFVSERQYWDFQLGIAVPALATMKIGRRFKNLNTGRTVSAGIRVFGDTDLDALSFESIAIVTVSHRWYFD